MHGLLIVNKPEGISSFDVVRRVRRVFATRKVGHGGTLDPLATGVLPVAVGQGTKLLEFLLEGDKVYRATLRLGVATDTQDREGAVIRERDWTGISPAAVAEALDEFRGEQLQRPPMYSALKHRGQPLYKLARQGVEVEREPRRVVIRELRVLKVELPEVRIELRCSKGTYVRTLIHDLGERLGCGAHMTSLQRTAALPFQLAQAIDFDRLEEGLEPDRGWFGLLEAVAHLPQIEVSAEVRGKVWNGVPPRLDRVDSETHPPRDAMVAISHAGELLALARFAPGGEQDPRGDFVLRKVFHRG